MFKGGGGGRPKNPRRRISRNEFFRRSGPKQENHAENRAKSLDFKTLKPEHAQNGKITRLYRRDFCLSGIFGRIPGQKTDKDEIANLQVGGFDL